MRAASTLHARGCRRTPRGLEAFNWWVCGAVLPPEVTIGQGLLYPNTVLGDGVDIPHGVTIGSLARIGAGGCRGRHVPSRGTAVGNPARLGYVDPGRES